MGSAPGAANPWSQVAMPRASSILPSAWGERPTQEARYLSRKLEHGDSWHCLQRTCYREEISNPEGEENHFHSPIFSYMGAATPGLVPMKSHLWQETLMLHESSGVKSQYGFCGIYLMFGKSLISRAGTLNGKG